MKDVKVLEAVQRRFTRMLDGMKGVEYEERLRRLNLDSLEKRRKRGDLIEAYKQLKGQSVPDRALLVRSHLTTLRNNGSKLIKPRALTNIRNNFFSYRVINSWNRLPQEVVASKTVEGFKRKLDECWSSVFPKGD